MWGNMNSHSSLTSGNQQNNRHQYVVNDTANCHKHEAVEESYLRSCALKWAKQGNYTQAIAFLNELIRLYPHNAVDYNNRGLIHFQSGENKKAFCD